MNTRFTRRSFLGALAATGSGLLLPGSVPAQGAAKKQEASEQVTVGEDLMREHGVLERLLLIYEDVRRRAHGGDLRLKELGNATSIIRRFIQDYHEMLEENYLFTQFVQANKLVDLVHTLKTQHDAGRRVTTKILDLTGKPSKSTKQTAARIDNLTTAFIRMYRPHYAREDTVLFREFPNIVGTVAYHKLGERFEEIEHQRFGENGFEKILTQVEAIEKRLGLYNLAQYTPKV